MKIKSIRGMEDILPDDIGIWQDIEKKARDIFNAYGYREIRTPILEEAPLFVRSIGDATDIVRKEMYTFKDRKERSLALRPEGTAPIIRSYLEHGLNVKSPFLKLYYIGPMFRSERPQKGRSRQFHQIGVEIIGTESPYADAEMFTQLNDLFKIIGLKDYKIKLNSLGCRLDKEAFSKELKKFLSAQKARLCQDCKVRIGRNPLRAMDCKVESCMQVVGKAPKVADSLCPKCGRHFEKVKELLKASGVAAEITPNLVRGLDYYTSTVFEITHPALGGQDAIGAGGRYDNLVKDLGGSQTGAVGYALGIERIIIALGEAKQSLKAKAVFIAADGEKARREAEFLARRLREEFAGKDISVLTDLKEASLNSQMRLADKSGARFTVLVGEKELNSGKLDIRDMKSGKQDRVGEDSIIAELKKKLSS